MLPELIYLTGISLGALPTHLSGTAHWQQLPNAHQKAGAHRLSQLHNRPLISCIRVLRSLKAAQQRAAELAEQLQQQHQQQAAQRDVRPPADAAAPSDAAGPETLAAAQAAAAEVS